eukprot:754994-Hanusia_phi.AAC.8
MKCTAEGGGRGTDPRGKAMRGMLGKAIALASCTGEKNRKRMRTQRCSAVVKIERGQCDSVKKVLQTSMGVVLVCVESRKLRTTDVGDFRNGER